MQEKMLIRLATDHKNIVCLCNSCQLKKKKKRKEKSQPKSWELCFIWWEFLGLQALETVSQVTLRELLLGGKGRNQGYIDILQQRAGSQKHPKITVD